MRPPKPICWVVLVAMLPQLVGCRSFYPVEGPLSKSLADARPLEVYRVITVDSVHVDLRGLWIDSMAVGGIPKREWGQPEPPPFEIPIEDVGRIEERRVDMWKTLAWSPVFIGLAIGVGYWALQDMMTLDFSK